MAAKYSLDGGIFSLILLSKIREKMPPSKYNLAIDAKKRLFAQREQIKSFDVKPRIPMVNRYKKSCNMAVNTAILHIEKA